MADKKDTRKDFISTLSDDVLNLVLSNLRTIEIVKTSILSVRWKHVSSLPSSFIFDRLNMFGVAENQQEHVCDCKHNNDKFVRGMNQFIESYKGSNINLIKICFCLGDGLSDDINRWIRFALQMGTQILSIELLCDKFHRKPSTQVVKYTLHSDLFEGIVTTELKYLHLVDCWIAPNLTNQLFSYLKFLRVTCSPLALYDLDKVFSCLVNLKHLKFSKCILPRILYVGSLRCLKILKLIQCWGIKNIQLSNEKLHVLQLVDCERVRLNLNGSPALKTFEFYCNEERQLPRIASQVNLSAHASKDMWFIVNSKIDWAKCSPLGTRIIFTNITMLKLELMRKTSYDIVKMISLLKRFPYLTEFKLVADCSNDKRHGTLQLEEYFHMHLKRTLIGGFYSTSDQIEFAKYLLKHAVNLELLIIQQEVKKGLKRHVRARPSWNEAERQLVHASLCHVSPKVNLIVKQNILS